MSLNRTNIEWVLNPDGTPGFSCNPIVGCSYGCDYCYARLFAKRNARRCVHCETFTPHFHADRLAAVAARQRPAGIFVCSMGELFDQKNHMEWIRKVLDVMDTSPQHRFYVLSKQVSLEHFLFPPNVWLGVTCDGLNMHADIRRVMALRRAANPGLRFISCEPLRGPLARLHPEDEIDWIIVGAQTGSRAVKPRREWVVEILAQADAAGTPVFLKDNLLRIYPDLPRRQEVPGS